jgi:hypothetical protein
VNNSYGPLFAILKPLGVLALAGVVARGFVAFATWREAFRNRLLGVEQREQEVSWVRCPCADFKSVVVSSRKCSRAETMMTCGWYLGWVTVWQLISLAAVLTLLCSVLDDEDTPSTN